MDTIDKEQVNHIIDDIQIPPQPKLLQQIDDILNDVEPCLTEAANLIARDVAISASVLKIINSPFYGLQKPVVSIRQAALYIGLNGLVSIVKVLLLKQAFLQELCSISLVRFWNTSENVAETNIKLNRILDTHIQNDYLYVLGLFHDIGLPIFASTYSDYQKTLDDSYNSINELLIDIETRRYGMSHAEIGKVLASTWSLPESIINVLYHHHDHEYWLTSENKLENKLNALFQLSENMCNRVARGSDTIDWLHAKPFVLKTLNLEVEQLQSIQDQVMLNN